MHVYTFRLSHEYALRSFERRLASIEIRRLLSRYSLKFRANGRTISCVSGSRVPNELLRRLAFTHSVEVTENDTTEQIITTQTYLNRLPRLALSDLSAEALEIVRARKREHSYATHAFHPYKGKYYPQLVRAIINSCLRTKGLVLDPFCGSGTTLVEARLHGINSIGVDFHPLAALISRVKTESLSIPVAALERLHRKLSSKLVTRFLENGLRLEANEPTLWPQVDDERCQELYAFLPKDNIDYLQKWFDPITLAELAMIVSEIQALTDEPIRDLCWVTLSAFVREVSLQEPSSLRILRRKEPPEHPSVLERFLVGLRRRIDALKALHLIDDRLRGEKVWSQVIQGDAKQLPALLEGMVSPGAIDCIVTSPPYAMALPYIDTDRLSLFLLGLLKVEERGDAERGMVGNREISDRIRKSYETHLESPDLREVLPASVLRVIRSIQRANDQTKVGFRKRNTPALLLKYFLDMEQIFRHCVRYLRRGGRLVYVIGINRTVPEKDGKPIIIQTDELLAEVGRKVGLRVDRTVPMTDQAAYMRHSRNFIQAESIVFLQKK